MKELFKKLKNGRRRATLGLATLAIMLGATLAVVPTVSAAAVSCRVFTPATDFYEGGQVATKIYYVPGASVSGCKDINVRNIQNNSVPGDHCATFKVQFFPTWGDAYYNTPKTVCSTGPNGAVVPIATNVLNGTKYRVLYGVENTAWRHTFQIVD
jgi:hypothetical protein